MTSYQNSLHRLRVAEGFLEEARQDIDLRRWRSAVDNCQLAAEHAAKAVLSLIALSVARTTPPHTCVRLWKKGT